MNVNEKRWIADAQAQGDDPPRRRRIRGGMGADGLERPDEPGGVVFTRAELRSKTKAQLFEIYKRHFNDEMSPVMWRGFTKAEILEMMLGGQDSVESPWA